MNGLGTVSIINSLVSPLSNERPTRIIPAT